MSERKKNLRTVKMEQNMAHVLEVWLANPLLSYNEIAEKAGISLKTFSRYRGDETFMANYDARCKERFRSLQAKAIETMELLIEEKHWNATKYALDGNDYNAKQKIEVSTPTVLRVGIVDDIQESD